MTPHLETVTDEMRRIARALLDNLGDSYYLAGGTALAIRLGHRKSVDLDYFSRESIDTVLLKTQLRDLFPDARMQVVFEERNTLWTSIDGVKVSFISRFEQLLDSVDRIDVFPLAGVRDITLMKLSAICGREEYKDYFDLACLATSTDVRSWTEWWREAYPSQDITSWLVAFSAVREVPGMPLEALGPYASLDVARVILRAVEEITAHVSRISDE